VVSHVILCSPIYDALHFSSLIKSISFSMSNSCSSSAAQNQRKVTFIFQSIDDIILSNNLCYMFVYIIHLRAVYLINIMLFW